MKRKGKRSQKKLIKTEKLYNDHLLIDSALSSPIWKMLLEDRNKALILILTYWMSFVRAMINFCFCSIFRAKSAGINQCGIIISVASFLYLLSFNSSHIWIIFTGFGLVYIPICMFSRSRDEIVDMLLVDVNSEILLYYNIVLIITSSLGIVKMYLGKTDQKDISSRGTSLLYLFLKFIFKKLKITKWNVSRQFIEGTLEIVILFVIGALLYSFDKYAAIFFFLMAASEATIQFSNKAATLKQDKLMHVQGAAPHPQNI